MKILRQNTATSITAGPIFNTDGLTPKTTMTVANLKLSAFIDDAGVPTLVLDTAPTASGGNNDLTHIAGDDSGGWALELTAANVNYVGRYKVVLTDPAQICPVVENFFIVPAMVYDFLTGADRLDVNATHIADQAVSLSTLGILWIGTLAAVANGTVTLPGGHGLDHAANLSIVLVGGTDAAGKSRFLTYSGAGEVWNVDPAWNSDGETTPSGTVTAYIMAAPKLPTTAIPTVKIKVGTGAGELNASGGKVPATIAAGDVATDALSAAAVSAAAVTKIQATLATSAEVTAIQNNTRVVRVVPGVIERPDSGTQTYRIELFLYDAVGNMEAPDSAPTIALVNQAGTDRSSRLDSPTMALVSTGRYRAIYTAAVPDTLEQLVWAFSVVEGGATRLYGNNSLIVDTTAVDFTASDRSDLQAALGVLQSGVHGNAALKTLIDDLPTNAELATAFASADDAVLNAIAALVIPTAVQISDALLVRNAKGGSNGPADESVSAMLAGGAMKMSISGATLTVKYPDGTTAFTRTLTRAAADAIAASV